ncbi:hypothetical protein M8J77_006118 [Diaphorina citri]|nr:hypothetical protein M8J77_006118 [Diaphorina citri]
MWRGQKRHPISREPSTYNTPTLDLLDAQETHGKEVSGNLSNPLESDKIGRPSPRTDKNGEGWWGRSRTLAVCEDPGVPDMSKPPMGTKDCQDIPSCCEKHKSVYRSN